MITHLLIPLLVTGLALAAATRDSRTRVVKKPQPSSFVLTIAERYEDLKAWDKAEEQYLKIGQDASESDRQKALAGLTRVHQKAKAEKRMTALAAAQQLADTEHWKEAEEQYIDLIKSDPEAQNLAAERLASIGVRENLKRWPERVDQMLLNIGRIILIPSILLTAFLFIRAVFETRGTVKFVPFRASTDDGAKQLAFWLEHVLADLRSPSTQVPLASTLFSSLPFMDLPSLADETPEFNDLEIGGAKIPLKQLFELFGKPRARITGNWYLGTTGAALSTVEKRRGFSYFPFSSTFRAVQPFPGPAQDSDLELFAYAVFIEAAKA